MGLYTSVPVCLVYALIFLYNILKKVASIGSIAPLNPSYSIQNLNKSVYTKIMRYILILAFLSFPKVFAKELYVAEIQDVGAGKETADCHLTVGWGIWAPYQYLSEDNEAQGVQIDLLNSIATEANCVLNFVQQPFSQNVSDIQVGKIDLMADTTITERRQSFAFFSDPYRHEISILYVKKDRLNSCKDKSLEQLLSSHFILGLTQGNLYGNDVKTIQNNPELSKNILYLKENKDAMAALIDGKIDGYFEDPIVLAYELKKRNLLGEIKSCRIELYAEDVSLMFSRKTVNFKIVERFNSALVKIRRTAQYKSKWEW